jgi:hypothetical protein
MLKREIVTGLSVIGMQVNEGFDELGDFFLLVAG